MTDWWPSEKTWTRAETMKTMLEMTIDHQRPKRMVMGSWKAAPKKHPAWNRDTRLAEMLSLLLVPNVSLKLLSAIVPPKNCGTELSD